MRIQRLAWKVLTGAPPYCPRAGSFNWSRLSEQSWTRTGGAQGGRTGALAAATPRAHWPPVGGGQRGRWTQDSPRDKEWSSLKCHSTPPRLSRPVVLMNVFAGQEQKHGRREQTRGHSRGGSGWDELREAHCRIHPAAGATVESLSLSDSLRPRGL